MEFADWAADGDGKLTILLLDIKDGYEPGGSYVGGYFWAGNFGVVPELRQYSNDCDMIYIDTYPSTPGSMDSNAIFAHEMQHMMNFATGIALRGTGGRQDVWIDEGLSSAAEWIYSGRHNQERINWYNEGGSGLIDLGNNFFMWENHENNPNAVLDDYATVYLFFQWLRLQADSSSIYKSITTSGFPDERAVTAAMDSSVPGQEYSVWGALLKTWLAANCINASSGPYGYKDDPALKLIKARTVPDEAESPLRLYPGEGVYSVTKTAPTLTGQGENIKNTFLNSSGKEVRDTSYYPNGVMITYNTNRDIEGAFEIGQIMTGIADSSLINAAKRHSAQTRLTASFKIDASHYFRRKNNARSLRSD